MSRRILSTSLFVAAALVVAITASGAAATPLSEHRATGHTLAFTAKHTGIVPTGRRTYVLTDAVVQHGQQIGADVLACRTRGSLAHCSVSLAVAGGQMRLRITLHESGDLRGRVVGGDGRYAGAAGRVRGTARSESAEHVVVHWHG